MRNFLSRVLHAAKLGTTGLLTFPLGAGVLAGQQNQEVIGSIKKKMNSIDGALKIAKSLDFQNNAEDRMLVIGNLKLAEKTLHKVKNELEL